METQSDDFRDDFAIVHILLFFSFSYHNICYCCALVWWFEWVGSGPDEDTGMWILHPAVNANRSAAICIIPIDFIM